MTGDGSDVRDPGGRAPRVAAWVAVVVAGAALVAISLPALVAGAGGPGEAIARAVFAPVCHQSAARSFALDGGPFAVCARCHGLYAGGLLGAALGAAFAAWRRSAARWTFLAAVLPTVVQWASVRAGAPDPSNLVRFALAVPAGLALGWFLAAGAGDLGASLARWLRERSARTATDSGVAP